MTSDASRTKILRRLAEATNEDFWGKGHEYVNAALKGWLDDARARMRPTQVHALNAQGITTGPPEIGSPTFTVNPPLVSAALAAARISHLLEQQASPQPQIVDGKLDAAPNTVFDKPQYSDNLANLPSELTAYTKTIITALPRNCPGIVRSCFTGFHDELLVRGNRPIVNILKGMAASLQAELFSEFTTDTSPDEWPLRDLREWGPGMGAMFAHFFKGYLDLIHHFPLDPERETLIANTPIDEDAASGASLIDPVDAIAEEVVKAGERGDASDNFVRIIEAMRLYNRDIAQLPPSGQPTDAVTPKRRHVLMMLGFYVSILGALGSVASLYSLPTGTFGALAAALQQAIAALLAFVK